MLSGTQANTLFGVCLLFSALPVTANMVNGDFEHWTDSTPHSWSTIDSGIRISQSTHIIKSGNSSAAVEVTTQSQDNTDLLQKVAVEAGKTYRFSADIYHTEGHVRTRLYVDDYQGYSNESLVNQWQTISYSYTASTTKIINVGLRFYDVTGFDGTETVYVDNFLPTTGSVQNNNDSTSSILTGYYVTAQSLTGYALKTELYNIINNHNSQGYTAIWDFYDSSARDKYFENDNSILDMYSEKPNGSDSYNYTAVSDQCGNYSGEDGCYNREHSFPKSWFGGTIEPMNSDVHHIYATDGYVNSKRSNFPFGEVSSASFTSTNGSKLGSAGSSLNYSGTVFEPIDEFKGDFARAYFYMATRYENVIGSWQNITSESNAVLNGSSDQVFENWVVAMLLNWHNSDPVSQMELDRNQAAFEFQGNRNPYIDHPEFVEMIW